MCKYLGTLERGLNSQPITFVARATISLGYHDPIERRIRDLKNENKIK